MEKLTVDEIITLANSIDTTKPTEHDYLCWHHWRMRCVERAIMLFCVKLHQWGYDAFYSDTYFFARKNGHVVCCQYQELLHSYEINHEPIERNFYMEITESEESFAKIFNQGSPERKVGYYSVEVI